MFCSAMFALHPTSLYLSIHAPEYQIRSDSDSGPDPDLGILIITTHSGGFFFFQIYNRIESIRQLSIPRRLPLILPLHERRLLVLVLVTHPPPRPAPAPAPGCRRRRTFPVVPIDPAASTAPTAPTPLALRLAFRPHRAAATTTTHLPHHRPRLALLFPRDPLRVPRLALPGVLVDLRSLGWRFRSLRLGVEEGLLLFLVLLLLLLFLGSSGGCPRRSVMVGSRFLGFALAGSGGAVAVGLLLFGRVFVVASRALPLAAMVLMFLIVGSPFSRWLRWLIVLLYVTVDISISAGCVSSAGAVDTDLRGL